jgi:hypothetical protein
VSYCARNRPLRIDVYGARGTVAAKALRRRADIRTHILDSLDSTALRRLEGDIFVRPGANPLAGGPLEPEPRNKRDTFTLIWPKYELSHGDLFGYTYR